MNEGHDDEMGEKSAFFIHAEDEISENENRVDDYDMDGHLMRCWQKIPATLVTFYLDDLFRLKRCRRPDPCPKKKSLKKKIC